MRTLILIKHAKPTIVDNIPAKYWVLSPVGRENAATLAQKIAVFAPQTVISSVEPKAVQTAQVIANELDIPHGTFENLHEHDRGNLLAKDSQEQFEAKVSALFTHPNELVYGVETGTAALQRFSRALDNAIEQYAVGTLSVVTHGTVITLYLAAQYGLDPFPLWKSLQLPSYAVLSLPEKTLLSIVPSVV